jgi:hypothetical protein
MYSDFLLATDCKGTGQVAMGGAASSFLSLLSRHKRSPSIPRAIHPSGIPTPAPITIPRSDELDFEADVCEDFDVFPSTAVATEVELEVIVSPDPSVVVIALTSPSTVAVTVTLAAVTVVVVIAPLAELMSASSAS